jgi:hypothetical protein
MLAAMTDDLVRLESDDLTANVPAARPRWIVPLVCGLAGVLLGAGVVGGAWAASSPADAGSFALHGTLTLSVGAQIGNSTSCAGSSDYADIKAGTAVTVYDDSGKIVGTGSLGEGQLQITPDNTALTAPCQFQVTVPEVSKGPKFYQVEVSHRGRLTVSAADAQAGRFSATLG